MSKELIHPEQFSKVPTSVAMTDEALQLNDEQRKELAELCEGVFGNFKQGNVVKGRIVKIDSDGVLVDIGYKSDGLIPRYEFGEHELKRLIPGMKSSSYR
jgi:small subunit ribosomal protein S1